MKWEQLAAFLEQEPMIFGGRISPEALKEIYGQGLAIKLEYNEEIIGFHALWPTDHDSCLEEGSIWIKPDWRNLRMGSKLMEEIYRLMPTEKKVFGITHNPKVVHLMKKHEWREASAEDWSDVIPFEASCGPCDRVTESEKLFCPLRATEECRMFFL